MGAMGEIRLGRHSLDSTEFMGSSAISNPDANEHITRTPTPLDENQSLFSLKDTRLLKRSSMLARPRYEWSPIQQDDNKSRRFSLMKLRHASESQLSTKARLHAQIDSTPSILKPQEIVTSASSPEPTATRQRAKIKYRSSRLIGRSYTSSRRKKQQQNIDGVENVDVKNNHKTKSNLRQIDSNGHVPFETSKANTLAGPPPYGDDTTSTLALPVNRLSDSSRSDISSGDHGIYATTTTTHTVHTTTTLFRLPRRRKQNPLFNLSHLPKMSENPESTQTATFSRKSSDFSGNLTAESSIVNNLQSSTLEEILDQDNQLSRHESRVSNKSSPTRSRITLRGRSSTLNSVQNLTIDESAPAPTTQSARTSSSTGRKSLGELLGLSHKLHQNSDANFSRHNTGLLNSCSSTPKNSTMQLPRDQPVILPERHEDDTPARYLIRLEEAVSRGVVASVLSRGADSFSEAVLRSYMRGFGFFGDPMDMAIRKLLMEVELPKETQQIDRCLQGFANRYHECNPGIYASPDQAYFIAFSLLILHTDVFNKNNKHKMQKSDYLKNTRGDGIFDEILECFYDNISYTPFIHVEDDIDFNSEGFIQQKAKKKFIFSGSNDNIRRSSKEPIDPYTIIIDRNLDSLRPNLKDVLYLEEHYSYLGTAPSLNLSYLQRTFFRTGILQIVSARSRPDAFMSDKTVNNPEEAQAGIVDIKISKVGLLWRKDPKKKKTRSPWQEWGAILTGAQLYFFKNTTWIKSLMNQLDTHIKQGLEGCPVVFNPPLDQFKPDALMSTDDSVALLDSLYKKHKNAFVFVRHAGFEETFLADNEDEMNDWLAKLNYAAAFRTSGVRMRGLVGGSNDGQRSRGICRMVSPKESTKTVQTPSGEVNIVSGKIDPKMAQEILSARQEIMLQKIAEAEEKLAVAEKNLDSQLRNARHLQILAPIQPKTRENILMAAGRTAAQLKWGRIRIWRLKCHRDILRMDLDDVRI